MATTALMPVDPAVSPQQVARVLTIRANLLPQEITARRNAQQMRTVVIIAGALAMALLAGWYLYAYNQKRLADADLATVTEQINTVRQVQNQDKYQKVVTVKNQNETIKTQLKILLADDLPWAALLTTLRTTGTSAGVTVTGISGALVSDAASTTVTLPSTAAGIPVATVQITGTGPDKKTIAKYVDQLDALPDVTNPYLTTATQTDTDMTFTLSADVLSTALCGRFTTTTTTCGGN